MELVPIIYRVLLISGGLFVVVLIISFISSKFVKKSNDKKHRQIIQQRKVAYSREQLNHLARMRQIEQAGLAQKSYDSKTTHQYPRTDERQKTNIKEKLNPDVADKKQTFSRNNQTMDKSRRYSVLNDTMRKNAEIPAGNKEVKIFYPIDFQKSA